MTDVPGPADGNGVLDGRPQRRGSAAVIAMKVSLVNDRSWLAATVDEGLTSPSFGAEIEVFAILQNH